MARFKIVFPSKHRNRQRALHLSSPFIIHGLRPLPGTGVVAAELRPDDKGGQVIKGTDVQPQGDKTKKLWAFRFDNVPEGGYSLKVKHDNDTYTRRLQIVDADPPTKTRGKV